MKSEARNQDDSIHVQKELDLIKVRGQTKFECTCGNMTFYVVKQTSEIRCAKCGRWNGYRADTDPTTHEISELLKAFLRDKAAYEELKKTYDELGTYCDLRVEVARTVVIRPKSSVHVLSIKPLLGVLDKHGIRYRQETPEPRY